VRRGGGNILNRMADFQHFITRLCENFFWIEGQPELPNHDGYEFVRPVDEIIPLSARRVGKHIEE